MKDSLSSATLKSLFSNLFRSFFGSKFFARETVSTRKRFVSLVNKNKNIIYNLEIIFLFFLCYTLLYQRVSEKKK